MLEKREFSSTEAISYGWQTTKKNLGFFIVLAVIYLIVNSLGSQIKINDRGINTFVEIIFFIISSIVGIGFLNIGLKFYDGKEAKIGDLFKTDSKILINYLLGQIVVGIIIILGLILLIVPGIIWMLKYQFVLNLVVDKKMDLMDAMRKSAEITKGVRLQLFGFNLLMLGVVILGVLALGVGLLVALPVIFMADIYVYRKLLGSHKAPAKEETADA